MIANGRPSRSDLTAKLWKMLAFLQKSDEVQFTAKDATKREWIEWDLVLPFSQAQLRICKVSIPL